MINPAAIDLIGDDADLLNLTTTHPAAYRAPISDQGDDLDLPNDVVCRLSARCHEWLEQARTTTNNPGIQRLIDDLHDDLWALGPIDDDLEDAVRGALASVAAAIDTDAATLSTLTLSSLN